MTSRGFDSAALQRITAGDFARWAIAAAVIATAASAGVMTTQRWSPAVASQPAPEPAMLIDLAPLPAPEPVVETPPEIEQPVVEPPPPVDPEPPVAEPIPPVEEPPPEVEPEVTPPPVEPVVQPEPEVIPEPEPVGEEPTVSDIAMPVMMSPDLRQRRAETPVTPRPQRDPAPRKPVAEPQQTPRPVAAQPPAQAAAPSVSPDQWQSQVLRRLDQRKVYPRAARDRGESGAVVISFAVDGGGRVTSVGVARSSGFTALDQAAIETARRASPLPRPPAGFAGQSLSATIRFTLRQD